jgi:hypothetical protein
MRAFLQRKQRHPALNKGYTVPVRYLVPLPVVFIRYCPVAFFLTFHSPLFFWTERCFPMLLILHRQDSLQPLFIARLLLLSPFLAF